MAQISAYRRDAAPAEHPEAPSHASSLGTYLFSIPSRWEIRLVVARILVVAFWLALMFVAFDRGYRYIFIAMFCVLLLGIVASAVYQHDRWSRELPGAPRGQQ
jgi:peptidoglycan/LPS O-acetylase OafA/YrhL